MVSLSFSVGRLTSLCYTFFCRDEGSRTLFSVFTYLPDRQSGTPAVMRHLEFTFSFSAEASRKYKSTKKFMAEYMGVEPTPYSLTTRHLNPLTYIPFCVFYAWSINYDTIYKNTNSLCHPARLCSVYFWLKTKRYN